MDQVLQSLSICCALPPLKKIREGQFDHKPETDFERHLFTILKISKRFSSLLGLIKCWPLFSPFSSTRPFCYLCLLACLFGNVFPILSAIK